MRWWAYLFWIWAIVSLVIFIVRRMNARRAKIEGSDTAPGSRLGGAPVGEPVVPAAKVWPAPPPPEPGDDTYRRDPADAVDPPTRSDDDSTDVGDRPESPGDTVPAKPSISVTTTLRPSSASCAVSMGVGALGEGSAARLGLGEGDDLADVLLARQERHQAVDAEGEAGVGRRPEAERVEQEPELGLASSSLMPSRAKMRLCTSRRWIRTLPEPSSQPLSTRS
jgi:hypothetical protein